MKSLDQRIAEALREEVSLEPYDPNWPNLFAAEADLLWATLPRTIVKRIEHFGSTGVPGLAANRLSISWSKSAVSKKREEKSCRYWNHTATTISGALA